MKKTHLYGKNATKQSDTADRSSRNAEIINMRLDGYSQQEIADKYSISHSRVDQILYEAGHAGVNRIAARAAKLLDYICAFKASHDGNSPTVNEMIRNSAPHAYSHLIAQLNYLQEGGFIRIEKIPGMRVARIEIVGAKWIPHSTASEIEGA